MPQDGIAWAQIIPAVGIIAAGAGGAVTGLDILGIEEKDARIERLLTELDREQLSHREDMGICVSECRVQLGRLENERDWLRDRCQEE